MEHDGDRATPGSTGWTTADLVDAEPGGRGVDVEFGNARFRSGGWVYADANSVLSSAEKLV